MIRSSPKCQRFLQSGDDGDLLLQWPFTMHCNHQLRSRFCSLVKPARGAVPGSGKIRWWVVTTEVTEAHLCRTNFYLPRPCSDWSGGPRTDQPDEGSGEFNFVLTSTLIMALNVSILVMVSSSLDSCWFPEKFVAWPTRTSSISFHFILFMLLLSCCPSQLATR
jgi:hypothetical protein